MLRCLAKYEEEEEVEYEVEGVDTPRDELEDRRDEIADEAVVGRTIEKGVKTVAGAGETVNIVPSIAVGPLVSVWWWVVAMASGRTWCL
ncbi:hypothetical protein BGW38_002690 [Lunasporangiospora selenospora]|uniref:Uncharacterized protein n=1 Tax=Lunasporangiospora selenospora TaxID=979761 RepID=A0A9P6FTQ3_9FUNG|nr:hypothetical protein BGW38_002690 [Lunasporangiospora selenospora]